MLLVTGLSAASDTGGITSAMVESCRVDVLFVAGCCGTVPFGTNLPSSSISTPVSTDTLQRCFSAVVCVQVVIGPFAALQKLSPGTAEAAAKCGACGRPQFACGGVCRRIKRVLAHAGVWALILACLLLVHAYRWSLGRSLQFRSCRQVRPRPQ